MNTRTRRAAGSRNAPVTGTIQSAFEDGKNEIECLHGELEEWQSSLENNSMEHLPKYDEVTEAKDALESAKDTLESAELPDHLQDLEVRYTQDTRQSAASRSGRQGNAYAAMEAAKSAVQDWLDDNGPLELIDEYDEEGERNELGEGETFEESEVEEREEQRDAAQTFIDEVENALSELDNVSYPGMY